MSHMAPSHHEKIRVLIVDDCETSRKHLIRWLSHEPNLEIIEPASDGCTALAGLFRLRPDVVILDLEMPKVDGLQTLSQIRAYFPSLPVIIFSSHMKPASAKVLDVLALGANDYVGKPSVNVCAETVQQELIRKVQVLGGRNALNRKAAVRSRWNEFQSPGLTAEDVLFFQKFVSNHCGVVFAPEKQYFIESRLRPLALREGFGDLSELFKALRVVSSGPLHNKVIDEILTNETCFWRDNAAFDFLCDECLPCLMKSQRTGKELRIWSAACSTGQEAYCIAMQIQEHFPALAGWDFKIWASDISEKALVKAKRGAYSQKEIERGLPTPFLSKYFSWRDNFWWVADELKSMIEFQYINLSKPFPYLPEMDIIFLRNVLIYFDPDTQKEILRKMRALMHPDSFLFLGSGETIVGLGASLESVGFAKTSCYQLERLQ